MLTESHFGMTIHRVSLDVIYPGVDGCTEVFSVILSSAETAALIAKLAVQSLY